MLDLLGKDFKSGILNIFNKLRETMCKELKKSMRTMSNQIQNIN